MLAWGAVALWAAFIFFMSAHTGSDLDEGAGLVAEIKRWLSAVAAPVFGEGTDIVSVAAHFSEYAVLGALLLAALHQTQQAQAENAAAAGQLGDKSRSAGCAREGAGSARSARWLATPAAALLAAILIASLYGASDEFHQLFVPGRLCDAADWLTDTCGAALGASIAAVVLALKGRRAVRRYS